MHCPLFSRAWGPKVGIKIYDYSLAITLKLLTVNTVVHITDYNPHIQMACDVGEQIL